MGSVVAAHRLSLVMACGVSSCHTACGILVLHQGSNLHPLHWKVESKPLDHQGSPRKVFLNYGSRGFFCSFALVSFFRDSYCSCVGLSLLIFNIYLSWIHFFPYFPYLFVCLFVYLWLHWVFVAACGLSLVVASGGYSSLWCTGFSLQWLLLLRSMGSRRADFSSCGMQASVAVACGL